jgi:hypothetical protein
MSELSYIGGDELVFNNDVKEGIHSGGFSVKSIMMKAGMSPIMTINTPDKHIGGSSDKVSDLFNDLVVPNWTLSYNNRIIGGKYKEPQHNESDSDDEVVNDDLHERLLDLVKQHNVNSKVLKKRVTRKNKKHTTKKGGTKRNK